MLLVETVTSFSHGVRKKPHLRGSHPSRESGGRGQQRRLIRDGDHTCLQEVASPRDHGGKRVCASMSV